jgi:hypothetical protein
MPGAGLMVHEEQPAWFAEQSIDFLRNFWTSEKPQKLPSTSDGMVVGKEPTGQDFV